MVQLGADLEKKGLINSIKSFFQVKEKEWDTIRIRYNKERMKQIFFEAIYQYNLMVSERETVDKNGVHIAERLIVPNEYRLITGYHSTNINDKIQTINEDEGVFEENINTTVYVNLLIGYDWQTMTIVIIQIDAELSGYSKIFVFTKQDILKAKYSWFSDTFQIYDKSDSLIKNILTFLSSKNRTIFVINAESDTTLTDNEGKLILVYMKQTEEKEDFVKFFKEFAK